VTECPELPRIHALADGELTPREAAGARAHLQECERCRAELVFLMQLAIAVARGIAAFEYPS
jgi:anti-sigma factor RsiW